MNDMNQATDPKTAPPTVTKLVITGGPCGGKTSALARLKEEYTARGYAVFFVPETATELIGAGITPWGCMSRADYQRCQVPLQYAKEETFVRGGRSVGERLGAERVLVFCDRGVFDSLAYMGDAPFDATLASMGTDRATVLAEYGAVFHLVTAADGAESAYTTSNNTARVESAEEARAIDRRTVAAWSAHPHHRVIDNSTDFAGKLDRLVAAIDEYLNL